MNNAVDKILDQAGPTIRESLGGNGIRELVQQHPTPAPVAESGKLAGRTRNMKAGTIDIRQVTRDPNQPRQQFAEDELERLSQSMKAKGQLQNIRVRWGEELGKWVIIAGERRYRAALKAGLTTLNCEFVERDLTEAEILEDQLVENCLREDLDAVDLAMAYRRLMQLMDYTQQQLAESLSVSNAGVSKTLSVLDLPEDLQGQVKSGGLAATTAYEISRLPTPEAQRDAARQVAEEKLTRTQAAELVQGQMGRRSHATSKTGLRFTCKMPTGENVTVSAAEPLDLDRLIESLESLLKAARRTRQKDGTLTDLAAAIKAKHTAKEEEIQPA